MELPADGAQFDMEGGGHHGFVLRGDIGKLGVHLRADVLGLDRVHRAPGAAVAGQRQLQHALDDALLGLGEVAPFHAGVEAAVAAEQVVHHQEHQVRVVDEQRRAAQRLQVDQVQVGRHRQVAGEIAELLDPDAADRNIRAAADEIEQCRAQRTGKALVDDFQRMQAAADDAFLRRQVVRAHPAVVQRRLAGLGRIGLAGYALEQLVDLVLREELVVGHLVSCPLCGFMRRYG
ncbi:hypothetical protein D9M72_450080 [compost metagenome]